MKSLLLACALFGATTSFAESTTKILMLDYVGTDMERIFELKTSKFDKVLLDCQSFIQGMTFYNNDQIVHNFYIDSYQCEDVHSYLQSAKDNKTVVCLEIAEDKSLSFVESFTVSECQ